VGALGDVLVAAGQAAFDEVQGGLHLRYSPEEFITVAAGDLPALLDVGDCQDVADVGQGQPRLLGQQDARDPVEVEAAVPAAASGRAGESRPMVSQWRSTCVARPKCPATSPMLIVALDFMST
jgi:hypothetical protein